MFSIESQLFGESFALPNERFDWFSMFEISRRDVNAEDLAPRDAVTVASKPRSLRKHEFDPDSRGRLKVGSCAILVWPAAPCPVGSQYSRERLARFTTEFQCEINGDEDADISMRPRDDRQQSWLQACEGGRQRAQRRIWLGSAQTSIFRVEIVPCNMVKTNKPCTTE